MAGAPGCLYISNMCLGAACAPVCVGATSMLVCVYGMCVCEWGSVCTLEYVYGVRACVGGVYILLETDVVTGLKRSLVKRPISAGRV